ncbi:hypothetical protein BU24DRAFT_415192 [Aaosphaeria arxii CBS 175.79]|uniref:RRM domain-containing protein n=1 Tax=Aaosphaeria arxii CBS 175.79 TaxID=1450172 RepID=A0A6A5X8P6_9PLEO|nr:uncharacterized protein BU24DRAFT_415192 [Aaosphaeria arxii CBS 175.79]KAF2009269.1 hypothetical protein BU24DRAFT_415192 [Aaosphaeria arxii CBS 175.79]
MSKSATTLEADAWEARKEDKKKKQKKEKRAKVDDTEHDEGDGESNSSKKRKREALPDEIEIDVNLPEPTSKKEARKAKKAKAAPQSSAGEGAAAGKDEGETKAAQRSQHGVWIGNLPWSATKESLRSFLTTNSEIKDEEITRVHMPAPTKPPNPRWTFKPLNKGFAYVDFSTELAMYAAIALTETLMDRRPLLIKNAKSFEGRPDKPKGEEGENDGKAGTAAKPGHPPNKRVFVGNLSFDVTKDDLQSHYAQCGEIADIHMATFEDSGKCKGYAWVTFEDVEAATSAVKGFIFKEEKKDPEDSGSDDVKETKLKKRKWFINRLMGRELRCEFAEDSTTRYNKRFGKEKDADMEGVHPDRARRIDEDDPPQSYRPRKPFQDKRKVDPRTIKPGAAQMNAQRAPQGIVKSEGKKITFD